MKQIRIGYDIYRKKEICKLQFKSLPKLQLFNPSDVISGNPLSNIAVGIVYTWRSDTPPEEIRKFASRVSNISYLTGYWRTTNGARYVFSNILGNPNVNKLLILVFDAKDNGHFLVDALVNFWKTGVDKDKTIIGSIAQNPRFEQVPAQALERVRSQADLIVLRDADIKKAEEIVSFLYQEPENAVEVPSYAEFYSTRTRNNMLYDDGCRYNAPFRLNLSASARRVDFVEKKSHMPVGKSIIADNLDDAIKNISALIFKSGHKLMDQRGIITYELRSISIVINRPLETLPEGFSKDYLKRYIDGFMKGKERGQFAYTYHDRIFNRWGNQVEKAVRLLKRSPESRRCIISLWDPSTDLEEENPPCLNLIWIAVRDNKLEMHPVYRSHHLATITSEGRMMEGEGAFVPNLYALGNLQKHIADKLGIETGPIVLTDFSGHLYVNQA